MTNERTQFETDSDLIDFAAAYNSDHILYLAQSVAVFGSEMFKAAKMIQDVKHLEAIHDHHKKGITTPNAIVQAMAPYLFNRLTDEIMIVTGFENVIKADLIFKGYVVHEFENTSKGKLLKAEQKAAPLLISRMIAEGVTKADIKPKTITMSRMLDPSYTQALGMPSVVVEVLKKFNKRRNNLHFITEMSGELGKEILAELKTLDGIIDRVVAHIKDAQR